MKFLPTKNIYKASNFEFNLNNTTATSYGWWVFLKQIDGLLIFNNTRYSISTQKHQYKAKELMTKHHIVPDVIIEHSQLSLEDDIKAVLKDEIKYMRDRIEEIDHLVNKKGTHKSTNYKRRKEACKLRCKIKQFTKLCI